MTAVPFPWIDSYRTVPYDKIGSIVQLPPTYCRLEPIPKGGYDLQDRCARTWAHRDPLRPVQWLLRYVEAGHHRIGDGSRRAGIRVHLFTQYAGKRCRNRKVLEALG